MKEEIKPSDQARETVKTGRGLDAEIARFLGWPNVEPDCYTPIGKELCGDDPEGTGGFNRTGRKIVPRYSESIEAAWTVIERMRELGRAVDIESQDSPREWVVRLWANGDIEGESRRGTLPEAICLAALSAVDSQ